MRFGQIFSAPLSRLTSYRQARVKRCKYPDSQEVDFSMLPPAEQEDFRVAIGRFTDRDLSSDNQDYWRPLWVLRKPRSTVLVLELGQAKDRLFLKRKRVKPNQNCRRVRQAIAEEAKCAQNAEREVTTPAGCTTVRILATYPDLFILVCEYVEGPSLESAIIDSARFFGTGEKRPLDLVAIAGEWLSSFQQNCKGTPVRLEMSTLTGNYNANWLAFRKRYPILAKGVSVDGIMKWAENQYCRLTSADLATVLCHGDYGLFNMLITKRNSLVIIDFEGAGMGSRLSDAYYFLYQLWKLRFNPLIRRSFLAKIQDVFCESYGMDKLQSVYLARLEIARRYMGTFGYLGGERSPRNAISSLHDRWFARTCVSHLMELVRLRDDVVPALFRKK